MPFRPVLSIAVAAMILFAAPSMARAEEVRLKHGALTLNAQLDLAAGKTLKQGLILLVHGTLAHNAMETLTALRGALNGRGLSTLAINLSLGMDDRHGMYDCKNPHRHTHLDALDEIGAWMEWLKASSAGPVALFGHSRGGNQAARFAADRSHPLLDRLILLAPATWDKTKAEKGFESRHKRPLAPDLAKAQALAKAGKASELMVGSGVLYCPGADVTAASFASYYTPDPRFDTPAVLAEGKIKVPILVMAGTDDTVVSDLPEKMKGKADGHRIKFETVDGAGHFFLDLFAEDVADLMKAFVPAGN